jgi:hypothetical protein
MPELDPDVEAAARRQLTRLVDAVVVPSPSAAGAASAGDAAVDGLDGVPLPPARGEAAGRRRVRVVGAAAAGVVVAAAVTAAILGDGDASRTATAPTGRDVCRATEAEDGVIGRGRFGDGVPWAVRFETPGDDGQWIEGVFTSIDGEGAGGWSHNERSWPSLVDLGVLTWHLAVHAEHLVLSGQVPSSAARVEVDLQDGQEVTACPVTVPSIGAVSYFAVAIPAGAELVAAHAVDAQGRTIAEANADRLDDLVAHGEIDAPVAMDVEIDRDLVDLPLGGQAAPPPPAAVLHDVVRGELPSGRWSLRVGHQGDEVRVELQRAGGGVGAGVQGTPDQLLGADATWHVDSADGRHIVWGLTSPDVAEVVVTLHDRSTVRVPTVDPEEPRLAARAFAGALPEGAAVVAIEGRRVDGTSAQRAVEVEEALAVAEMTAFDPDFGVSLQTVPVA